MISGLVACNSLAKEGGPLWGLAAYVLAFAVWPHVPAEKKAQAEQAHATAKGEWENAVSRWRREACQSTFKDNLHKLEKARSDLADLPKNRQRAIAKLESERETHQRQRYLDRFRIDRAEVPGIGSSRTAMLASYGIETAADVERGKIYQIPGFGQKLTGELLKWRREHERNFCFNPAEPLDRRDVHALDRDLESQRADLLRVLGQGPEQLRQQVPKSSRRGLGSCHCLIGHGINSRSQRLVSRPYDQLASYFPPSRCMVFCILFNFASIIANLYSNFLKSSAAL